MRRWLTKDYWLERLPFYKAVLWIFFTTVTISGSALFGLIYYRHIQEMRTHDSKYAIQAVIQNCCEGKELPTLYIMEILNLSADKPFHLYNWNMSEAEHQLHNSPYIRSASIERIPPDTLKINYSARVPIATIGDLSGASIDKEGYILPAHTLFGERALPKFILGLDRAKWGTKMVTPEITLALRLKELIDSEFPKQHLESIDVSRAFARSAGKRQAVIIFENEGTTHILRVTAQNYHQQLANYRELVASGKLTVSKFTIIDLRLNHLAYLTLGDPNDGIHRDSMDSGKH